MVPLMTLETKVDYNEFRINSCLLNCIHQRVWVQKKKCHNTFWNGNSGAVIKLYNACIQQSFELFCLI
jgi:hypothetical protein